MDSKEVLLLKKALNRQKKSKTAGGAYPRGKI